ncbi:hypothetical protein EJ110_NYTH59262 [Nymphaea thermarum]|nr:hypothetical protein EJ110_NYTH59262 [Nymphaea thermarum]
MGSLLADLREGRAEICHPNSSYRRSERLAAEQEVRLSDSEDNILISSTGKADCNKEESLCTAVLGEDLIDEENEATPIMEQKEQEQISVEGTESFSPVAEGRLGEGMTLTSSTDSPDPTFYSHNHVCTIEVEKSCDFLHKDGDLLNCGTEDQLMSDLSMEVKTGESSFICEQLEHSCLAELKATDSMIETDRAINDHENGTMQSDCDANSTISYHKPEAAHLVNFLTGKNDVSGQAVQGHPSSISFALSADFSDGGFLEMEESKKQNGRSRPANVSVEGKINSNESISPSSHRKKNLGLENVRGVNSDTCFMLTPGSGSMSSQITNGPENSDSQIVSSDNDDFSEHEVNLHELVPVSQLETNPKPKIEEFKHVVGGTEAYYIASTRHSQNADIVASHAQAGAMIASTSNSISSNSPVTATRKYKRAASVSLKMDQARRRVAHAMLAMPT